LEKIKKLWRFCTSPEMILYLVFGVLTTVINIVAYTFLRPRLPLDEVSAVLTANAIAWVLAVAFAFITNKLFVFQSKSFAARLFWWELITFVGARLFSLVVDEYCMYLLVTVLKAGDLFSKIVVNVLVVIINYVFSKLIIFKKKA
jgi:putative flippase GtrA